MKLILSAAIMSLFVVACASKKSAETTVTHEPAPVTPAKVETKTKATTKSKKEVVVKEVKSVPTHTTKTAAAGDVDCKSGTDERTLAIVAKGEGCELQYTKAGKTSTVASQSVGNEKCDTVSTNIKEKLIASGYTCQ